MTEEQPLVLATPQAPAGAPSGRVIAKALRDNALSAFPPEAFEEDVVFRSFFGRQQIILNRPAGHPSHPRREPRQLSPHPRHHADAASAARQRSVCSAKARTGSISAAPWPPPLRRARCRCWRAMSLAPPRLPSRVWRPLPSGASTFSRRCNRSPWRSPARRCFRWRWSVTGRRLRDLITGYLAGLGRPSLLDFLLPLAIPSPRDLARRRVRRRWVDLISRIIAERRGKSVGGGAARPVRSVVDRPRPGERRHRSRPKVSSTRWRP